MGLRLRVAWLLGAALLGLALALSVSPGPLASPDDPAPRAPAEERLPQDDIVLTLSHGFSANQAVLQWTGGLPAFIPYRATSPTGIVAPGNALGSTGSYGWLDFPPPGAIFYYEVRGTGCASDAGCPTGHCADAYCCDAACSGTCQACDHAGAEGTCLPIARGEDPDGDCGAQGRCDGSGNCLLIDGVVCAVNAQCLSGQCNLFFRDADVDDFGTANESVTACGVAPPSGYTSNSTDCDDTVAAIHPGAIEIAGDEVDQDCDGLETCFDDKDEDGFRTGLTVASSDLDCADAGEARASEPAGDCNDADPAIHPGAAEITGDEVDGDCNGLETCFQDTDDDGFRTSLTVVSSDADCVDPGEARASEAAGDCNDTKPAIHPGAAEIAGDEIDQNCDGRELCYRDADNDGFRLSTTVTSSDLDCADSGEARAAEPTGDCCDANASAHPGQADFFTAAIAGCSGFDYDCDGSVTLQFQTSATGGSVCGGSPPLCTDLGTGWVGTVPACGVTAPYRDCSPTCTTQTIAVTQGCR